jgi:hypothetical protein
LFKGDLIWSFKIHHDINDTRDILLRHPKLAKNIIQLFCINRETSWAV